jgi:hypothetical protein
MKHDENLLSLDDATSYRSRASSFKISHSFKRKKNVPSSKLDSSKLDSLPLFVPSIPVVSTPGSGSVRSGHVTNVHTPMDVSKNQALYNPQFTSEFDPKSTPIYTPMPHPKYETRNTHNSNSSVNTSMSSLSDSTPNPNSSKHSKYMFFRNTIIQSPPYSDQKSRSTTKKIKSFVSAAKSTVLHPFSFHSQAYVDAKKQAALIASERVEQIEFEFAETFNSDDGSSPRPQVINRLVEGNRIERKGSDNTNGIDRNSDYSLSSKSDLSEIISQSGMTTNYDLIIAQLDKDGTPVHGGRLYSGNNGSNDDRLKTDIKERNDKRKEDSRISLTSTFHRLASNSSINNDKKSEDVRNSSINFVVNDSNDKNNEDKNSPKKKNKFSNYEIIERLLSDTLDEVGVSLFMSPLFAIITIFISACILLLKPVLIFFVIVFIFIVRSYGNKKLS